MTDRYLSFVLRIDGAAHASQFNGQVVLADGREVELEQGTYMVRVWMDAVDGGVRGIVRNQSSNETVRFQSGDRLASFIQKGLKRIGGQPVSRPQGLDEGVDDGA